MRTAQEIEDARSKVCEEIAKGGLTHDQLTYLQATSVALCWAAGIDNTLSQLMAGKPIERAVMKSRTNNEQCQPTDT